MALTCILNLTSITVLSAFLAYLYHNTPKTELLHYYAWMHFCAILAVAGDFITYLSTRLSEKIIMTHASLLLTLYFSVTFLNFSIYYYRKKHMRPAFLIVIGAFPSACMLAALVSGGGLLSVENSGNAHYGTLYIALSGIGYFMRFFGCVFIISSLTKKLKNYAFKLLIMIFALSSFSVEFMFGITSPDRFINVHPVLVLIIFTFIYFGSIRLELFNTMSLGVRRSLELYNEAVFVLDKKGRAVYSNLTFKDLEPVSADSIVSASYEKVRECRWEVGKERLFEASVGNRILTLAVRPLITVFHSITGFVCVVHDDTGIKKTISDLKSKNRELVEMNQSMRALEEQAKRLAVVEERNILAKEIHDVMGHSLILALQILESNRIIYKDKPEAAIQRLRQVVDDIDRGIDEIAAGKTSRGYRANLDAVLGKLARRLALAGVELEIIHDSVLWNYSEKAAKTVYRICQEACTNAIKHGKADHVTVSIQEKDQRLQIHIVDNGRGCTSFTKGRGLNGMEERVASLGGAVQFNSFEDGNGFIVHAWLPVNA